MWNKVPRRPGTRKIKIKTAPTKEPEEEALEEAMQRKFDFDNDNETYPL